jgi:hypothetical protein
MRGKKPLLAATLTVIAVVCFIVLHAIAFHSSPYRLDANGSHDLLKHAAVAYAL